MQLEIYTDGSIRNIHKEDETSKYGYGGYSHVIVAKNNNKIIKESNDSFTCGKLATAYAMEFMAISESIQFITELSAEKLSRFESITIYSDCQALVTAINGNSLKIQFLSSIKFFRTLLWKEKKLKIKHIKGHNGNRYNEMADMLANKASEKSKEIYGHLDPEDMERLPNGDLFTKEQVDLFGIKERKKKAKDMFSKIKEQLKKQ